MLLTPVYYSPGNVQLSLLVMAKTFMLIFTLKICCTFLSILSDFLYSSICYSVRVFLFAVVITHTDASLGFYYGGAHPSSGHVIFYFFLFNSKLDMCVLRARQVYSSTWAAFVFRNIRSYAPLLQKRINLRLSHILFFFYASL